MLERPLRSPATTAADPAARALVEFDAVSKSYDGRHHVVHRLNLAIAAGEFVTLLGPSGSGKTTTLMMLAGFEVPTSGEIFLEGRPLSNKPPHERGIGMVFQNYALFPHMTVAQNLAFPLELRKVPRAEIETRVRRALDMVRLPDLAARRPSQLSGGQQQRVALARALVFEPKLVLMDEPLGALDKQLREQMQYEIRALHERLGVTVVYVTHDQSEALTMSDRVAVFSRGRVRQVAPPDRLYAEPADAFVARFIGESNQFDGTVAAHEDGAVRIAFPDGRSVAARAVDVGVAGAPAAVVVRPERLVLGATAVACANRVDGTVADVIFHGDHLRVRIAALGRDDIIAKLPNTGRSAPHPGSDILVGFETADARAFDPDHLHG